MLRRSLRGAGLPAALQPPPRRPRQLANLQADLDRTETHLDQSHLDHLQRLHERCEEEPDRLATLIGSSQLVEERQQFAVLLDGGVIRAVQQDWAGLSAIR
ncbi:hypothetical protein [Synechococcus sp. CS-1328]|uniref:hypothetical protein n=1 Tax=Synechococcus sp. CS-1328 TaxID=2847976 RepID=UPI00223AF30C|nr:hypothetical protein [Synechococcus sp. CS-1328]MCT0226223.1 hypothetical protein [Synechococcus sp. CS-1328]